MSVYVENDSELESKLKEASNQIIQKEYESQLTYEGYDSLIKYGMSFKGKKCRIALVK